MRNPVKINPALVVGQAAEMAQGADKYQTEIEIDLNTATKLRFDMSALSAAMTAYGSAKAELTGLRQQLRAIATTSRRWLMAARDTFKPDLGIAYNVRWDETGLVGSLEISRSETAILPVLAAFQLYLSAHPEMEVPSKGITAARAGELYERLNAAIGKVNHGQSLVRTALNDRNAKSKKLRYRLRATINALSHALGPIDPRWAAFGLNEPGRKAVPPKPATPTVTHPSDDTAQVEWPKTPRAEHYRVWKRKAGSNEEMVAFASSADRSFLFKELSKEGIEVALTAVNSGGESLRSETVVIQRREQAPGQTVPEGTNPAHHPA